MNNVIDLSGLPENPVIISRERWTDLLAKEHHQSALQPAAVGLGCTGNGGEMEGVAESLSKVIELIIDDYWSDSPTNSTAATMRIVGAIRTRLTRLASASRADQGGARDGKSTEQEILDFAITQWGTRNLVEIALKLAEECGEVAGAAIKMPEGRATLEDFNREIGDVLIVLSQLAARQAKTLTQFRDARFAQIKERAAMSQPSKEASQ